MAAKRRWSERMLLVINLTVANIAAAIWLATFLQPSILGRDLGAESAQIADSNRAMVLPLQTPIAWIAFLTSVGLLLWNFSWLVRRRQREVPSNWVVCDTPAGPLRIAREAIESGLRTAGEALPEITRLRVNVRLLSQKRISVTSQFYCADGQNHLAASQRLRQRLLDRFAKLVSLSDTSRTEFEIEFQGFFGKLGKNDISPPLDDNEGDQSVPFRGPQYPIDDDPIDKNS